MGMESGRCFPPKIRDHCENIVDNPQGEVGILTRLEIGTPSALDPHCIIIMRWNDQDYLGSLFFDDLNFRNQIVAILRQHIGSSISEIGSLNTPC